MNTKSGALFLKAETFLNTSYHELEITDKLPSRLEEVKKEIAASGTYLQTVQELTHGASMAWRNSNRCIGRLYWKTLKVIDARHCSTRRRLCHVRFLAIPALLIIGEEALSFVDVPALILEK